MIKKGINNTLLFFASILLLTACGNSKQLGTPTGIIVEPAPDAEINYGSSFKLLTFITYSKGGRKEITGKSGLDIQVSGAEIKGDEISITSYPTTFLSDSIYVKASYIKKDQTFSTNSVIPFNYKGDLKLIFNGAKGSNGEDGKSRGAGLILRHGKDGDIGGNGGDGQNGHDLSVHIYKNEEQNLYFFRVVDLNMGTSYFYKNRDLGYAIRFYSNGGNGGDGGAGGDGGDGKDGSSEEKKIREPGDGGNGGNGGNGGLGGNGGSVYVFVHPSAADITNRINLLNIGGAAGEGGAGGKAGKAGTPVEEQSARKDGVAGNYGSPGAIGQAGPMIQISVENFDIDF